MERRRHGHRRPLLAAAAVLLVLVPTAWLSWPHGSAPTPLAPGQGVLFGAFVNGSGHGVAGERQVAALEADIGHRLAIVHTFDRWGDAFPTPAERAYAAHGQIPFLNLKGIPSERIVDGSQDGYLRARARAVRDLGRPVMISYYAEMDRRSRSAVGTPQQFVEAWRHIVGIFRDEGAHNAVWVWCATGDGLRGSHPNAPAFYPGDGYVDWACFDAYDWPRGDGRPHRSFADIAGEPYRYLVKHMPGKPIMLGEFGTVEDPADPEAKARWFAQAAETIRRDMPDLHAVVYFDAVAWENGRRIDWRIGSSPQALEAWVRWARQPYFRSTPARG